MNENYKRVRSAFLLIVAGVFVSSCAHYTMTKEIHPASVPKYIEHGTIVRIQTKDGDEVILKVSGHRGEEYLLGKKMVLDKNRLKKTSIKLEIRVDNIQNIERYYAKAYCDDSQFMCDNFSKAAWGNDATKIGIFLLVLILGSP